MPTPIDLIPCPAGCGNQVHPNARECPHCGYQTEMNRMDDLLSSLGTISSILVGFGLAALVQMCIESKDTNSPLTSGLWIVSSLLLLGVLVGAEVLRRRDLGRGRLQVTRDEVDRLWRPSEWLLATFALALLGTGGGVLLLGFSISIWHGLAACLASIFVIYMLWKTVSS